jgi:hypothetical protein
MPSVFSAFSGRRGGVGRRRAPRTLFAPRQRGAAVRWLLLAALVLPAAAASPNTLHIHAADPANMDAIPMNVLPPPDGFRFRHSGGPTAATLTCLPGGTQSHTVHAIQYAGPTDDAQLPQAVRGEWRGLAYPTRLTGNVTLHWFVEAAAQGGPVSSSTPLANVVVRGTLREGESAAGGVEGYGRGALLAQGQSAPALLAGSQTRGAQHSTVDGRDVYGFTVPLAIESAALTTTGFNLRVDVFVENPACPSAGGQTTPPLVVLHSSPGHRPALEMGVEEPLRVLATNVTKSRAGIVHLMAEVLPLWGGYAGANATVETSGPSVPGNATTVLVLPRPADPNVRPSTPAYLFWNWAAAREGALAGTYTFALTATDRAGNEAAAPAATFEIEPSATHPPPSPTKGAPSLPFAAVIFLLGAGAVLRFRARGARAAAD